MTVWFDAREVGSWRLAHLLAKLQRKIWEERLASTKQARGQPKAATTAKVAPESASIFDGLSPKAASQQKWREKAKRAVVPKPASKGSGTKVAKKVKKAVATKALNKCLRADANKLAKKLVKKAQTKVPQAVTTKNIIKKEPSATKAVKSEPNARPIPCATKPTPCATKKCPFFRTWHRMYCCNGCRRDRDHGVWCDLKVNRAVKMTKKAKEAIVRYHAAKTNPTRPGIPTKTEGVVKKVPKREQQSAEEAVVRKAKTNPTNTEVVKKMPKLEERKAAAEPRAKACPKPAPSKPASARGPGKPKTQAKNQVIPASPDEIMGPGRPQKTSPDEIRSPGRPKKESQKGVIQASPKKRSGTGQPPAASSSDEIRLRSPRPKWAALLDEAREARQAATIDGSKREIHAAAQVGSSPGRDRWAKAREAKQEKAEQTKQTSQANPVAQAKQATQAKQDDLSDLDESAQELKHDMDTL